MKRSKQDVEGLFDLILEAPNHLQLGLSKEITLKKRPIERIVIAGMGGSAISGMIMRDIFPHYSNIPVEVYSNETLPSAGENDLLIAISYSGSTGETNSMLRSFTGESVIGISSSKGFSPVTITVPSGLPPRFAFYYIFSILTAVISKLTGKISLMADLQGTCDALVETLGHISDDGGVVALSLPALEDRLPIVYSPYCLRGVAYRWKTQFNENAKQHAFTHTFPEMCHNEIVPYIEDDSSLAPILLRSAGEGILEKKQMNYFSIYSLLEFEFSSSNAMEEALKFILLGDLLSYGLASLKGVDPMTIEMINKLKEIL